MAEGVRIVEFLDWFTLLLGFVVGLTPGVLYSIGLGVATYHALRGKVSRRVLWALVIGIPLAPILEYYLIVAFAVFYIMRLS